VSATQVVLIAVAVVIFAAGWMARGRREAHERVSASSDLWAAELDRAIGAALTSFQAVLAVWQGDGQGCSGLGARVVETFQGRRAAVIRAAGRARVPPVAAEALGRLDAALDRVAEELVPFSDGEPLDRNRERALFRAERELTAARAELLLAAAQPLASQRRG
jgi:hypothetical protein